MIITRIAGGLGNQLFQYAIARRISVANRIEMKLDITDFDVNKSRPYSLCYFNITQNIATKAEIDRLKGHGLISRLIPNGQRKHWKESKFNFDPSVLQISDNAYLDGYWQSEKYFKDIEEVIRNDFTLINRPTTDIKPEPGSVSISFRRGDYVTNRAVNRFHGVCPLSYYKNSIQKMDEYVDDMHLFVFSDDIEWARANFATNHETTFVQNRSPHEDLHFMSQCDHYILANSSFSWWGAWLCKNKDKIVIAPKKWFADNRKNTKDLFPFGWLTTW